MTEEYKSPVFLRFSAGGRWLEFFNFYCYDYSGDCPTCGIVGNQRWRLQTRSSFHDSSQCSGRVFLKVIGDCLRVTQLSLDVGHTMDQSRRPVVKVGIARWWSSPIPPRFESWGTRPWRVRSASL